MAEKPLQYRKGKKLPVTDEWKARLLAALGARGKTQQWLESQLGVSKGTLTQLLNRSASSILVEPICRILELDPPVDSPDPIYVEYVEIFRRWTPEQRAAWMAVLRSSIDRKSAK